MALNSQPGRERLAVGAEEIYHDVGLVWNTAAAVGGVVQEDAEHAGVADFVAAEAGEAVKDEVLAVSDEPVKDGQQNWEVSGHAMAAVVVCNAAVNIVRQAEEADANSMRDKLIQDHNELAKHDVVGAIEVIAEGEPTAREYLGIRCGRKWKGELFY